MYTCTYIYTAYAFIYFFIYTYKPRHEYLHMTVVAHAHCTEALSDGWRLSEHQQYVLCVITSTLIILVSRFCYQYSNVMSILHKPM